MEPEHLPNVGDGEQNPVRESSENGVAVDPQAEEDVELLFGQCLCHSRGVDPSCPFGQRRLAMVAVGKDASDFNAVWDAINQLKRSGGSSAAVDLTIEFPESSLSSILRASIKCTGCKFEAIQVLDRIRSGDSKHPVEVEVLENTSVEKPKSVSWVVSVNPDDNGRVSAKPVATRPQLKKKKDPGNGRDEMMARVSEFLKRPPSDSPIGSDFLAVANVGMVLQMLEENIHSMRQQIHASEEMVSFLVKIETVIEAVFIGISVMWLFQATPGPSESLAALHSVADIELALFNKLVEPLVDLSLEKIQNTFLDMAEQYLRVVRDHRDLSAALREGVQYVSLRLPQSCIFAHSRPCSLPRLFHTALALVSDSEDIRIVAADCEAYAERTYGELFRAFTRPQGDQNHPLRFIEYVRDWKMFGWFCGDLNTMKTTAAELRQRVQAKARQIPWYNVSSDLFLLSQFDPDRLDQVAQVFWSAVQDGRPRRKLDTLIKVHEAKIEELAKDSPSALASEHIRYAAALIVTSKTFAWSLGPLDFLLTRIPMFPKCRLLPDERSICFEHVLGRRLIAETVKKLSAIKALEDEEEAKRQREAEEAQNSLLAQLDKGGKDDGRKKGKKKTTGSTGKASTSISVVESGKQIEREESKEEILPQNGASSHTSASMLASLPPNVVVPEFFVEEEYNDTDEWEAVPNRKRGSGAANKQQSSIATQSTSAGGNKTSSTRCTEEWQGRLMCVVTVPDRCFGLVMGEKGKTITHIQNQSKGGVYIKALPPGGSKETRSFRIEGNTEDAIRTAIRMIRERVEGGSHSVVPVDVEAEKRFRIFPTAAQKILGQGGRTVKEMERETGAKITIVDTFPAESRPSKTVILGGTKGAVAKAYNKLERFANDFNSVKSSSAPATVTMSAPPPSTESAAQSIPKSHPISPVKPKPIMSQDQEEDEELRQAMLLSAQEARERHQREMDEIAAGVATTKVEDDSVGSQALMEKQKRDVEEQKKKEFQEAEDERLARTLAEAERQAVPDGPAEESTEASSAIAGQTELTPVRKASTPVGGIVATAAPAAVSPIVEEVSFSLIETRWEGQRLLVDLPQVYFGKVMGVNGVGLKKVETRARVKVDYDRGDLRPKVRRFEISGSMADCKEALRLMKDAIGEERSFVLPLVVHSKMFADGAKQIRVFEDATGCRITFQNNTMPGGKRTVTVVGSGESIRKIRFIFEQLAMGRTNAEALNNLKNRPKTPAISSSVSSTALSPGAQAFIARRHQEQQAMQQQQGAGLRRVKGMSGLSNSRGENSCFLNVVVQSLFHFSNFSEKMVKTLASHPRCRAQENPPGKCIVCALLNTFRALMSSEEGKFVSSVELREAVAEAFEGSFDMGNMEDAAEAFDKVLGAVHACIVDSEEEEENSKGSTVCDCLVHRCFASYVFEGVRCKTCVPIFLGNRYQTNERMRAFANEHKNLENVHAHGLIQAHPKYACLVRYIFAAEIAAMSTSDFSLSFEQKVKKSMEVNPMSCACCDASGLPVQRVVTRLPEVVFSLGVGWTAEAADPETEIRPFLEAISPEFDLAALTEIKTVDGPKDITLTSYPTTLRGLICFHRKHYVAFFRKKASHDWFEFDDAHVKSVGLGWPNALKNIYQRKFQPVVLFYEARNPIVG